MNSVECVVIFYCAFNCAPKSPKGDLKISYVYLPPLKKGDFLVPTLLRGNVYCVAPAARPEKYTMI